MFLNFCDKEVHNSCEFRGEKMLIVYKFDGGQSMHSNQLKQMYVRSSIYYERTQVISKYVLLSCV